VSPRAGAVRLGQRVRSSAPRSGQTGAASRGFSLIECMVTCGLVALLCTLAITASRHYTLRAGRLDAVDALTRIQLAQEQHRALHGMYSADLGTLRNASAQSRQGRYSLQLQRTAGESYTAIATALGPQRQDGPCPALTLAVDHGYPQAGPNAGCWNR
jgi:type IV pilus assembly protein PilE